MNKIFLILFIGLMIIGCNNYENKAKYEIAVGETVEIYYSTNSCCYYCLTNEKKLKHIKLIDEKTVESSPKGCEGCDQTVAFIFKAKSIGIETVELKHLGATMDCENNDIKPEKYLIEVK